MCRYMYAVLVKQNFAYSFHLETMILSVKIVFEGKYHFNNKKLVLRTTTYQSRQAILGIFGYCSKYSAIIAPQCAQD